MEDNAVAELPVYITDPLYKIVKGLNVRDLHIAVNKAMHAGWVCQGGLVYIPPNPVEIVSGKFHPYAQAMVLKDLDDPV